MNFLEGLKRLFIVFALIGAAIGAAVGFDSSDQSIWCHAQMQQRKAAAQQAGIPNPTARIHPSCMTDDEVTSQKVMRASGYGLIGGVCVIFVFQVLQWIIVGFFPKAGRKS